jgi:hypothetical protein
MELQFNTDNQIDGDATMEARAREIVETTLSRFASRLTRLELHLADENSPSKGGSADIRCTLEARPEGLRPIAVTHHDADPDAAMRGAARKLSRALDSEFGKLDARR